MKAASSLSCILLLALFGASLAAVKKDKCPPRPDSVAELDIDRYLGNWYQAYAVPSFFTPADSTCVRAQYGLNDDGSISVYNLGSKPGIQGFDEICGVARQKNESAPGDLALKFNFIPEGVYRILGTDYDSWAAVYGECDVNLFGRKSELAWVLTREPQPSDEAIESAMAAFTSQGVSTEGLVSTYHGPECVYENTEGDSCLDKQYKSARVI